MDLTATIWKMFIERNYCPPFFVTDNRDLFSSEILTLPRVLFHHVQLVHVFPLSVSLPTIYCHILSFTLDAIYS